MPSADQHRRKAEANRRFLDTISLDDYPDWAVTVAFYTAVHRVEQLRAARREGHSTSHEDRLAYVQERHPTIHTAYHILLNASLLARYESNADFFKQFQPQDVKEQIIERYLAEIERYVEDSLKPPPTRKGKGRGKS